MSIVNKDNKLELLKLTRNNYKDSKESLVIDINKLQYNKLINNGGGGVTLSHLTNKQKLYSKYANIAIGNKVKAKQKSYSTKVTKLLLSSSLFFTTMSFADTTQNNSIDTIQSDSKPMQSNLGHTTHRLESVVTTAGGFEQSTLLAPSSISVVNAKDLQNRPFRDLAEAISLVPGVDIDSGVGKTGGYGISIRGMEAQYTLILIDGKRIDGSSSGSIFPNGFGQVTTSFMPPISAIERIEIIRGPASTLYGSDAIGGVVNIITKQSFDKWGASINADYTLQEKSYFGNSQSLSFFTSGPLTKAKDFGLILRGRYYLRDRVPLDKLKVVPDTNGTNKEARRNGIVGLSHAQIYNVGGRLVWNDGKQASEATLSSPKNSAYLDIDFGQQIYDNKDSLLGTYKPGNTDGYADTLSFYRGNAILNYDGVFIKDPGALIQNLSLNSSLQYNITKNDGRTIPSDTFKGNGNVNCKYGFCSGQTRGIINHDIIADAKANIFFNFGEHFGAKTSFGARYWFNSFNDNIMGATGANSMLYQHIGAIFGESEFILWDNLFVTTGVRGNFSSRFGANVSPRLYVSYNAIDEWLVLKGGISTGYKAPALNMLIPAIYNFSGQGTIPVYGNPNLKPESSINYELSALSDNEYFSASITAFFTDFKDKISSESVSKDSTIPIIGSICSASKSCSVSVNKGRAFSYGMELYGEMKPIDVGYGNISLTASYTLNKTQDSDGKPITSYGAVSVPLHNFNTALIYNTEYFGVTFRGEMKAMQYRSDSKEVIAALGEYYKPYFLAHLGFNFNIIKGLRADFSIYNLFDFDFIDYAMANDNKYYNNFNYIREGRRYYFSITYEF